MHKTALKPKLFPNFPFRRNTSYLKKKKKSSYFILKISPESSSKKSSSHVTLPESITISFKSMNICYTFQKLPKKKIDSQRDCFPHYLVSKQLRPLQKHLHSKRGRITRTNSISSHSTAPVLKTHSSPVSIFSNNITSTTSSPFRTTSKEKKKNTNDNSIPKATELVHWSLRREQPIK